MDTLNDEKLEFSVNAKANLSSPSTRAVDQEAGITKPTGWNVQHAASSPQLYYTQYESCKSGSLILQIDALLTDSLSAASLRQLADELDSNLNSNSTDLNSIDNPALKFECKTVSRSWVHCKPEQDMFTSLMSQGSENAGTTYHKTSDCLGTYPGNCSTGILFPVALAVLSAIVGMICCVCCVYRKPDILTMATRAANLATGRVNEITRDVHPGEGRAEGGSEQRARGVHMGIRISGRICVGQIGADRGRIGGRVQMNANGARGGVNPGERGVDVIAPAQGPGTVRRNEPSEPRRKAVVEKMSENELAQMIPGKVRFIASRTLDIWRQRLGCVGSGAIWVNHVSCEYPTMS